MVVSDDTDFARMAEDLQRASIEARRAAERNPEQSEMLEAKARKLASAAARIRADAKNRVAYIALDREELA